MSATSRLKQAAKWTVSAISRLGIPSVQPIIIKTISHDSAVFTQGLAYCDGKLYESAGGEVASNVRRLNADDGSIEACVPVQNDYAEGIAAVDSNLFQLSWKSGTARQFRLPDLHLIAKHRYQGEGWGLAAHQGRLLASDGTSRLKLFDARFQLLDTVNVTSNAIPIRWLNDLECVGDRIYANVVASHYILEISATGRVQRLIDCRQLRALEEPINEHCVLNGIAYCSERNAFFVTGKRWRFLHLISIPN